MKYIGHAIKLFSRLSMPQKVRTVLFRKAVIWSTFLKMKALEDAYKKQTQIHYCLDEFQYTF